MLFLAPSHCHSRLSLGMALFASWIAQLSIIFSQLAAATHTPTRVGVPQPALDAYKVTADGRECGGRVEGHPTMPSPSIRF